MERIVENMLRSLFDTSGTMGVGGYVLRLFISYIGTWMILYTFFQNGLEISPLVILPLFIVFLYVVRISVWRLNDLGKSYWWLLNPFVFFILLSSGDSNRNRERIEADVIKYGDHNRNSRI